MKPFCLDVINDIEHLYPLYRETGSDVVNHIDVDIERLFQTFEKDIDVLPIWTFSIHNISKF